MRSIQSLQPAYSAKAKKELAGMVRGLASLYSWHYPVALVSLLEAAKYRPGDYVRRYWHAIDFTQERPKKRTGKTGWLLGLLYVGMIAQLVVGVWLIVEGVVGSLAGGVAFGAALIVAYPVVWAHLVLAPVVAARTVNVKRTGKAALQAVFRSQVVRLRARHEFRVVAVAGSVGKTSSKIAIAKLLGATHRVRWQQGNYNDPLTVPLIFFGHAEPGIFNIAAWLKIIWQNELVIRREYPYDFVVVELGTDAPGTIKQFAYVHPDLAVITGVTPEHMEYFGTLDAVAQEELGVLAYAKDTLVNIDDSPAEYLQGCTYLSYGLSSDATYYTASRHANGLSGQDITFYLGKRQSMQASTSLLGDQGAKIITAAVATAHILGLTHKEIQVGIAAVTAVAGRMQILPGVKESVLIDDTYNSTPIAAKAALDVLYAADAPQRIAILGSMNELGTFSPEAHREVGMYCSPAKLDWVITIGKEARRHLAPAAREQGCQVKVFFDPYRAGEFARSVLRERAVVLAKGSQNGVFAEEALKILLADSRDAAKLVRQSAWWQRTKRRQFSD